MPPESSDVSPTQPSALPRSENDLDGVLASITPRRIQAEVRALLCESRFRQERALPFHLLVERLAGPLGAEGSPDRWHALSAVRDKTLSLLPTTPGLAYAPPT